jgi:RIO kinase 1
MEVCKSNENLHIDLKMYLAEGTVTEILGRINEGKEAEIFLALRDKKLVAIKLYKDKINRSFKNKNLYTMPVVQQHRREARAIQKKSNFGIQLEESLWHEREVSMLKLLHGEGVSVPQVFETGGSSFIMEYIGDQNGSAYRLGDLRRNLPNPALIYKQLLINLEILYSCGVAHGDLSPYNILWFKEKVVIIDLPQSVFSGSSDHFESLFARDWDCLASYFSKLGVPTTLYRPSLFTHCKLRSQKKLLAQEN